MSGAEKFSNNGWRIVDQDDITRVFIGADPDGCTFRSGDVATVFTWLFGQIHARVERVTMLNGWRSVAFNSSVQGDPGSNHLSATAGDVNGAQHPYEPKLPLSQRGKNYKSGWSAGQQAEIRRILSESGGLFSWGLDYKSGWRDAMHFDITKGKTPAAVEAFAKRVAPPPPPAPPPPLVPDLKGINVTSVIRRWDDATNTGDGYVVYISDLGVITPAASWEEAIVVCEMNGIPAPLNLGEFSFTRAFQSAERTLANTRIALGIDKPKEGK